MIVVQFAPVTAVDAAADDPASDPVAAAPASSLPVEMLGMMHAGAARTGRVEGCGKQGREDPRIMATISHHTGARWANFLPAPPSRTVCPPR